MKPPRLRDAAIATGAGSLLAAAGLSIRQAGTANETDASDHDEPVTRWTRPGLALPPVRFDTGTPEHHVRAGSPVQNPAFPAVATGSDIQVATHLPRRVALTADGQALAHRPPVLGLKPHRSRRIEPHDLETAVAASSSYDPISASFLEPGQAAVRKPATAVSNQGVQESNRAAQAVTVHEEAGSSPPAAGQVPLVEPATMPRLVPDLADAASADPSDLLWAPESLAQPGSDLVPEPDMTAAEGQAGHDDARGQRVMPRPAFGTVGEDPDQEAQSAPPQPSVPEFAKNGALTNASPVSAAPGEAVPAPENARSKSTGSPPSALPGHSAGDPVTGGGTGINAPPGFDPSPSANRTEDRPAPIVTTGPRELAVPSLGIKQHLPRPAFGQRPDSSPPAVESCASPTCTAPGQTTARSDVPGAEGPQDGATRSVTPFRSPSPGYAALLRAPSLSYDNELILAFRITTGELEETISAFGTPQGVYLPMGEIARILDLALPVTDAGHYASGWVINEKRTLVIDLRQGQIVRAGVTAPIAPDEVVAFDDEMYLRADLLASILPLTVKVDLRDQAVLVTTQETFPFQARFQRDVERERLGQRWAAQNERRWPRDPAPWRALSFPVVDAELRGLTDDVYGPRAEFEMRGAADLAFLTARVFVEASSRDGLTGARLELGRKDPDGSLLGPLHATQFAIGDIATTSQSIGLRSVAGRGLTVSNAALDQTSVFDRVDLRGALPDGYEVELYRNNILVASTRTSVNGQFEFLQVPVDYGANVMRLVFYGPQGQTREEVRRLTVGDGRLAHGQLTYDFSVAQKDVPLLNVRPPLFLANADQGQWRAMSGLAYGLSSSLTVVAGAAATFGTASPAPRLALNAGLRSQVGGVPVKLDAAWQGADRFGLRAAAAATLGPFAMALSHAEYRGPFVDEVQAFTDAPLRRASSLDLNGSLPVGADGLPLIGRFAYRTFQDNRHLAEGTLRSAVRLGRILLSPALEYSASTGTGPHSSRLAGNFDLTLLAGSRTRLRGAATFDFTSGPPVNAMSAEIDQTLSDRDSARLSASHSFQGRQTQFALSFAHRFANVTVALDANVGLHTRAYGVGLRLSAGFLRHPFDGHILARQAGLASGGLLATRTFRDANANGRFDDGEQPLEGVTVEAGNRQAVSDQHGLALIERMGDAVRAVYQVDEDSLPDIALAPARKGSEFVARAGSVHAADIAILPLADIEGEAFFGAGPDRKGVSGLRVVLIGDDGKVRASARSRAGGAFLFERVVPGHYRIELVADQASRLGIELAAPIEFDARPDRDLYRLQMIVIKSDL